MLLMRCTVNQMHEWCQGGIGVVRFNLFQYNERLSGRLGQLTGEGGQLAGDPASLELTYFVISTRPGVKKSGRTQGGRDFTSWMGEYIRPQPAKPRASTPLCRLPAEHEAYALRGEAKDQQSPPSARLLCRYHLPCQRSRRSRVFWTAWRLVCFSRAHCGATSS